MKFCFTTKGEEETRSFASFIAHKLKPGDVLALSGDLGAGKTTFTQGIAKGLGIVERVNSPTFTIIKEYHGRLPLYHMDVYRLQSQDESLGFEEYFYGDGVTVIEWPSMIEDLPDEYLEIQLEVTSINERNICLIPHGMRYEALCKEIEHAYSSH